MRISSLHCLCIAEKGLYAGNTREGAYLSFGA
jgi:hypothetical protein